MTDVLMQRGVEWAEKRPTRMEDDKEWDDTITVLMATSWRAGYSASLIDNNIPLPAGVKFDDAP